MSRVVDWRVSVALVGTVYRYLSVPLAVPVLVAVVYGDDPLPFLVAILVALAVGTGLKRLSPGRELGRREGFLLVALTWLAVPLLGTIPYLVAGNGTVAAPANALFESMSGFTTTGATVLGDISFDTHSHAMLMWRQLSQWLGGMGILVLMVAILPELSVGGATVMREEAPGFGIDKLTPKIRETARILWLIYLGFTVLAALVYYGLNLAGMAPEMGVYNAVAHALTTLPTGGFSPEARSIEAFSPAIQWVVVPFMVVAGTNFALFWYAVAGQPRRLLANEEFRSYLLAMVALGAVVTGLLYAGLGVGLSSVAEGVAPIAGEFERAARHAAFQTAAIVTTTGYASMDFNTWSEAAKVLLLFAMFLGGSAGSAAGSVKVIRWLLVGKAVRRELFTTVHPEAVRPVRVDGGVLDDSTLRGLVVFVLLFLLLFVLTTLVLFLDGVANPELELSALEAMSAAIATVGNVGPGFGVVGPMGSYLDFSAPAKGWMVLAMWLGRLEVISVVVVLTPSYWRP